MTSRDFLIQAGTALYGKHWQSALARDLDTPLRTVQRWACGERRIRDARDVRHALLALLKQRRAQIDALVQETDPS